jgi:hypothetical protein
MSLCDALHDIGEHDIAYDLFEAVNLCVRELDEEPVATEWYSNAATGSGEPMRR